MASFNQSTTKDLFATFNFQAEVKKTNEKNIGYEMII
jgi:hypothetical protein